MSPALVVCAPALEVRPQIAGIHELELALRDRNVPNLAFFAIWHGLWAWSLARQEPKGETLVVLALLRHGLWLVVLLGLFSNQF